MNGVTTALELEAGVYPINALSQIMSGKSVINYGASTRHLAIRQQVMEKMYKPHLLTPAVPLPATLSWWAGNPSLWQRSVDAGCIRSTWRHRRQ
jgi:hypothetical protein